MPQGAATATVPELCPEGARRGLFEIGKGIFRERIGHCMPPAFWD